MHVVGGFWGKWNLFMVLQLAVPAFAIVLTAVIARRGWTVTMKAASDQSKLSARLERLGIARDRIVAALDEISELFGDVDRRLGALIGDHGAVLQTECTAEELKRTKVYVKRLSAAVDVARHHRSVWEDLACFPTHEHLRAGISLLPLDLSIFLGDLETHLSVMRAQGSVTADDVTVIETGQASIQVWSHACDELRLRLLNHVLTCEGLTASPPLHREDAKGISFVVDTESGWGWHWPMPSLALVYQEAGMKTSTTGLATNRYREAVAMVANARAQGVSPSDNADASRSHGPSPSI